MSNDGMRRKLNGAREMGREMERGASTCATSPCARSKIPCSSTCPWLCRRRADRIAANEARRVIDQAASHVARREGE